jgi:nanoRNase/pAp phosphatase (c-di-AMP/oligoRNAs hydrolase)
VRDLIHSSKQVLIVLPSKLCFDTAASALGLAQIILGAKGTVQIGSANPLPKEFANILDFSAFKIISRLQKREVVLSIYRKKGEVKEVRWREEDEKIQFIITPEQGSFEFDNVDLQTTGTEIDLVITVGCESLESAGELYASNPDFFKEVRILNIDVNPKNGKFGTIHKIKQEDSLSRWVLNLAEEEGLKLTKEAAEALFKGIFWASEGFRRGVDLKNPLAKLTLAGGELSETISTMFDTLSVAELHYMGKLISNMQMNTGGIIIAKIPHNDIQGVNPERIIYPEINLLSRVRDARVAIILSEYEKGHVLARCYSQEASLDVLEVFKDFTPVGDSSRAIFDIEGELVDIEKKVLEKIEGKLTDASKKEGDDQKEEEGREEGRPLEPASELPAPLEAPPSQPILSPAPTLSQGPISRSQMTPPPPIQPLPPAPLI